MKLSFSTNAFVRHSIFKAVEQIAAIGYQGIELLADAPHLYADSVTSSGLSQLRKVLDRTGLIVANVNANTAVGYYGRQFWEPLFEPSLANPDGDLRQWRIAYSKKCIDIACALGSPCVSLTSGRTVPGVSPEQSVDFLRDSLQELLKYAEDKSVRIGIEYESGLLIESFEELLMLIEDIDSPYLGANLDLGHSHVLAEDPETIVGALDRKIYHVHIEDIKARKHYHLIPGTGDIDFAELFGILEAHNYEGFATVELYSYPDEPEAAARQALSYLRTILSKEKK